jgi:hypothetical protein
MIYFKEALVVNFSQHSDDVILSPLKQKRQSVACAHNSFSAGQCTPKLTATQNRELKRFANVGDR